MPPTESSPSNIPPAFDELQDLKLAAEVAAGRAWLAVSRRKMVDRERYRIGALLYEAGLHTWSDDELKAYFAVLAAQGPPPTTEPKKTDTA